MNWLEDFLGDFPQFTPIAEVFLEPNFSATVFTKLEKAIYHSELSSFEAVLNFYLYRHQLERLGIFKEVLALHPDRRGILDCVTRARSRDGYVLPELFSLVDEYLLQALIF